MQIAALPQYKARQCSSQKYKSSIHIPGNTKACRRGGRKKCYSESNIHKTTDRHTITYADPGLVTAPAGTWSANQQIIFTGTIKRQNGVLDGRTE